MIPTPEKYIADFEFGYETDSLDLDGQIINKTENIPTLVDIQFVIKEFIGEISQVPPKFSAIKINGKRAYDLARKNIDFEPKAKPVNILKLECLGEVKKNCFRFEIECSAGTYIRSIARDLAYRLNSLATMTRLIRTESGPFTLENSKSIEDIIENPINAIIPLEKVLSDLQRINIAENKWTLVKNGVEIGLKTGEEDVLSTIYFGDKLFGVGKKINGKLEVVYRLYEGEE